MFTAQSRPESPSKHRFRAVEESRQMPRICRPRASHPIAISQRQVPWRDALPEFAALHRWELLPPYVATGCKERISLQISLMCSGVVPQHRPSRARPPARTAAHIATCIPANIDKCCVPLRSRGDRLRHRAKGLRGVRSTFFRSFPVPPSDPRNSSLPMTSTGHPLRLFGESEHILVPSRRVCPHHRQLPGP